MLRARHEAELDLTDAGPRRRRTAWIVGAFWVSGTVAYATALHVEKPRLAFTIALGEAVLFSGTFAAVMALVALWDRRRAARGGVRIASELGLAVTAILIWHGLRLLDERLEIGPQFWRIYSGTWMFQALFDVSVYGTVRGLMLAAAGWRRDRDHERRDAALVVAARDLELAVIRTQLQPHFVLNALNSLLALIDDDPSLARTMVLRLADLMQAVFDRGDVREIPLDRELDLMRAYLDIERIRLGARLTVRFDIADAARDVLVPPFLLQPIVENAVKHGVAPFSGAGTVTVSADVARGRLRVRVVDSGRALDRTALAAGTGRGLQITRRRLETAYGPAYTLTFDRGADETIAALDLPVESRLRVGDRVAG